MRFFLKGVDSSLTKTDLPNQDLHEADRLGPPEQNFFKWMASLDTPPKRDHQVSTRPPVYFPENNNMLAQCSHRVSTAQAHHATNPLPSTPLNNYLTRRPAISWNRCPTAEILQPEAPRVYQLHIPPICLPAQGWTSTTSTKRKLRSTKLLHKH